MTLSEKNKARLWASVPVVLLGGLVTTVLGFVHVALSDPSFAVEDRYYSKALGARRSAGTPACSRHARRTAIRT